MRTKQRVDVKVDAESRATVSSIEAKLRTEPRGRVEVRTELRGVLSLD